LRLGNYNFIYLLLSASASKALFPWLVNLGSDHGHDALDFRGGSSCIGDFDLLPILNRVLGLTHLSEHIWGRHVHRLTHIRSLFRFAESTRSVLGEVELAGNHVILATSEAHLQNFELYFVHSAALSRTELISSPRVLKLEGLASAEE